MKAICITEKLAQRIRQLRKVNSMTQEMLAARAGLHVTYVGKLERAEINPRVLCLEKLALAFNMPVSLLLSFPDDSKLLQNKVHKLARILGRMEKEIKFALEITHGFKGLQNNGTSSLSC